MRSKAEPKKITQIISLSQNYKNHCFNLDTMRPAIDSNSKKRQQYIEKMGSQRKKYMQQARQLQTSMRNIQNQRIISRLTSIAKQNRQRKYSRENQQELYSSRSKKRLNSVESARSFSSVGSNFRRRTLRQKQVQRQNIKLAERIANPKTIRNLAVSQLKKSYEKEQEIVRTRSRYSGKNQQILRSLALQGLKFDKKHLQYLPQLSNRKKSQLKASTSQQKIRKCNLEKKSTEINS